MLGLYISHVTSVLFVAVINIELRARVFCQLTTRRQHFINT
jgi:hypothetical protein